MSILKIILILFLIGVGLTILVFSGEKENLKIGEVEISEQEYNEIKELFKEDYVGIRICNIKKGECVQMINIDNFKEVSEGNGN